jgi:hypothetical protein
MSDIADKALPDDLARETKFQWLTRVGFLARGMLYILIGILAIANGRTEDLTGALEYVGGGAGRIMLIAIAVGLATYALWRLSDAAFGTEHGSGDWKALRSRIAAAGIGFVYLFIAYKAARVLLAGRSGAMDAKMQADTVLDLPGGWVMLGLASLYIFAAAAVQVYKAGKCSFLKHLDADAIAPPVKWVGRIGYAARGVIFLCVGWMLGGAALAGRANKAGGMEQALDMFDGGALYAVAGGLILFGGFSLVEARYRRIHRPPPARAVAAKVKEKVASA